MQYREPTNETSMPIFISYSHSDSEFAERLAIQRMMAGQHLDRQAGVERRRFADSACARGSRRSVGIARGAVKTSVGSEWVKKELSEDASSAHTPMSPTSHRLTS